MIKKLLNKLLGNHPNALSFKTGLDLTGLPIITLNQEEKVFNFLLDTGSTDNVIDSNILNTIKYKPIKNTDYTVYGMEGVRKKVELCVIELTHKNQKYPYHYLITDMSVPFNNLKKDTGVQLHGILGSKFFNKFKYVLDFNELIAYNNG